MVNQESSHHRPWGVAKVLASLSLAAFVALFALNSWPNVQTYFAGAKLPTIIMATSEPIATVRPIPTQRPIPTMAGVYDNAAAADAAYATAVAQQEQRATPVENTGQGEPIVIQQRAAPERLPAGDNVPTSEPIEQGSTDGAFGSKPVAEPIVNPQATHECKHGQVWTDSGCKNPTK